MYICIGVRGILGINTIFIYSPTKNESTIEAMVKRVSSLLSFVFQVFPHLMDTKIVYVK